MVNIRELLAVNIKEHRRKNGFSQDKLAELAGLSSQYLATIETCKKFPTPEMLDRLANALGIETFQLFDASATPEGALLRLERSIISNIEQIVSVTIKQAIAKELRNQDKK
jgi:transcriptional regulator with XRE-family HTH domain